MAYSTLPEVFLEVLGKETFLSNFYQPRNTEIAQLVWWQNPFIKGFSSQKPNAGSTVPYVWNLDRTFIENIEISHGLPPQNIRPKIYYQGKKIPKLANCFLVDMSAITLSRGPFRLSPEHLGAKLSELIDLHGSRNILFVRHNRTSFSPNSLRGYFSPESEFPFIKVFETDSIFHFVDALGSCRGFVGLHSGGVALAAAVRERNPSLDIECLLSSKLAVHPRQTIQKIHNYPDVRYTSLP